MARPDDRWNLNIHYHSVFLDAAPPGARDVLDVGCGDGLLSFDMAERGLHVVGIDLHAESIERAEADPRSSRLNEFVCGDVFTHSFETASFDLVVSNAMLHHVDAGRGLSRMRELVRPGGVVAVVGFALADGFGDRLRSLGGAGLKRTNRLRGRYWEHNAPVSWPPPLTTGQMEELARDELPGVVFRRLLSNRFSIVWKAPLEAIGGTS